MTIPYHDLTVAQKNDGSDSIKSKAAKFRLLCELLQHVHHPDVRLLKSVKSASMVSWKNHHIPVLGVVIFGLTITTFQSFFVG